MISTILKTASAAFDLPTIARTIIDSHFPNESEERKQERANELEIVLAQIRVNEAAARHPSLWVAGSRPAVLWICAVGIAAIIALFVIAAFDLPWMPVNIEVVKHAQDFILMLSVPLLGIGGMRTAEKFKGVARNNLSTTP